MQQSQGCWWFGSPGNCLLYLQLKVVFGVLALLDFGTGLYIMFQPPSQASTKHVARCHPPELRPCAFAPCMHRLQSCKNSHGAPCALRSCVRMPAVAESATWRILGNPRSASCSKPPLAHLHWGRLGECENPRCQPPQQHP
jgi:hypothetical protein